MSNTTTNAVSEQVQDQQAVAEQPEAPIVIQFNHVYKRYKLYSTDIRRLLGMISKRISHKVINASNDVSFTIRKGESVALLGDNGAGKSTILKMITGVTYPTEGDITVNGRVSALLELRAGFDRNLTGRENIHLRGKIWGLSDEEIKRIEPEIVKFAALGSYIDQPMRMYSSGMKARLGFAFSTSIDPDVLICDEALSVGDKRFRAKCRRRTKRLMGKEGLTLLLVTHSLTSAKKFCERGIVLDHGTILFDGPIDDAIAFYTKDDAAQEAADLAAEKADEAAAKAAQPAESQEAK